VPRGALIGRVDRRGRLLWSLPKGHVEPGETAEQAAIREVEEETGISGEILARLGTIDFWFIADGRRVHKTVHHFLLRAVGGELSDADIEVTEVRGCHFRKSPSNSPTPTSGTGGRGRPAARGDRVRVGRVPSRIVAGAGASSP